MKHWLKLLWLAYMTTSIVCADETTMKNSDLLVVSRMMGVRSVHAQGITKLKQGNLYDRNSAIELHIEVEGSCVGQVVANETGNTLSFMQVTPPHTGQILALCREVVEYLWIPKNILANQKKHFSLMIGMFQFSTFATFNCGIAPPCDYEYEDINVLPIQ